MKRSMLASFVAAATMMFSTARAQSTQTLCAENVTRDIHDDRQIYTFSFQDAAFTPVNVIMFGGGNIALSKKTKKEIEKLDIENAVRVGMGKFGVNMPAVTEKPFFAQYGSGMYCLSTACIASIEEGKVYSIDDDLGQTHKLKYVLKKPRQITGGFFNGVINPAVYTVTISQIRSPSPGKSCNSTKEITSETRPPLIDLNKEVVISLIGKPRREYMTPTIVNAEDGRMRTEGIHMSVGRDLNFSEGTHSSIDVGYIAVVGRAIDSQFGISMQEQITVDSAVTYDINKCSEWKITKYIDKQAGYVTAPSLGIVTPRKFEFTIAANFEDKCTKPINPSRTIPRGMQGRPAVDQLSPEAQ